MPGVPTIEVTELEKWTHNYIVSNLVVRENRLYLGDAVCSISVLRWDETSQELVNVARDYTPLWPISLETLSLNSVITCNNDCNLLVYNVNTADKRLEEAGNYYLGDSVNKFIPGALTGSSEEAVRPEQMFITSMGRIGVISEFDERLSLPLTALQRNLENVVHSIGGIKHSRWRAPKNIRGISDSMKEATGFLDGDFLEHFLELDSNSKEATKVMQGNSAVEKVDLSYLEVVRALEQLQSVH
ncbi:hypothetical protein M422DRAFT_271673 [Sphaerobolus stellatus SS14]|uniref:RSE1/DDB1/CPSF1 C-terminal domain-containing protein n=1 Tax=Sphaerobolus stellatus (strain SS14) TaxID=990650 RepID=A0A0C9UDJ7_SPHS4|nr:hypothetical protein M422DRAFT_271673 [Sphaerobolus stellatus SS14]